MMFDTVREDGGSTKTSRGKLGAFLACFLIVVALGIHIIIVSTIVKQPLAVNEYSESHRSAVWALYNDSVHRIGPGADFFAIYHAGHTLQQGESPYSTAEKPRLTPYFFPYRYLPVFGQTIGRLSIHFSPRTAYVIWICILEAFLAALIFLIAKRFRTKTLRCFSSCILLLSSPYFLELHMGQFTFLATALLAIGLLIQEYPRGWLNGRPASFLGTISFASAALIKIFPLVVIPIFVRIRRYWPGLALATAAILGTSIPYFISHPTDRLVFFKTNFSSTSIGMSAGNFGLPYLVSLIAGQLRPGWTVGHLLAFFSFWRIGLLGITGFAVLFSRYRHVILGAAAMILAHFLSYAHVWEHHCSGVIVIGLLMLLAIAGERHRPVRKATQILLILSLLLLALPSPFFFLDQAKDPHVWDLAQSWSAYTSMFHILPKVIPTVVLYIICMMLLLRAGFCLPWKGRVGIAGERG